MEVKEGYISGELVISSPPDPETGEPYFTIQSIGFSGPWVAGELVKMPLLKENQDGE